MRYVNILIYPFLHSNSWCVHVQPMVIQYNAILLLFLHFARIDFRIEWVCVRPQCALFFFSLWCIHVWILYRSTQITNNCWTFGFQVKCNVIYSPTIFDCTNRQFIWQRLFFSHFVRLVSEWIVLCGLKTVKIVCPAPEV